MGLDQYLMGKKFFSYNAPKRKEDGFEIEEITVKLGYWRKHPNLHGYIVQTFADGVDTCQEIELTMEQLKQVIDAVKMCELPKTEGFFFGESEISDEEIKDDIEQLGRAVAWLTKLDNKDKYWRSVVYRASW